MGLDISVSALSVAIGFVSGVLADPLKTLAANRIQQNILRRALYSELSYNLHHLRHLTQSTKFNDKSVRYYVDKLRLECYLEAKKTRCCLGN